MGEPLEWEDAEPHTLIVEAYDEDAELDYDIRHLPSCKWTDEKWLGETCRYYQCAVAYCLDNIGLLDALESTDPPLPHGPGEYKIKAWGRKYYVWDAGAYEYDAGLVLVAEP